MAIYEQSIRCYCRLHSNNSFSNCSEMLLPKRPSQSTKITQKISEFQIWTLSAVFGFNRKQILTIRGILGPHDAAAWYKYQISAKSDSSPLLYWGICLGQFSLLRGSIYMKFGEIMTGALKVCFFLYHFSALRGQPPNFAFLNPPPCKN